MRHILIRALAPVLMTCASTITLYAEEQRLQLPVPSGGELYYHAHITHSAFEGDVKKVVPIMQYFDLAIGLSGTEDNGGIKAKLLRANFHHRGGPGEVYTVDTHFPAHNNNLFEPFNLIEETEWKVAIDEAGAALSSDRNFEPAIKAMSFEVNERMEKLTGGVGRIAVAETYLRSAIVPVPEAELAEGMSWTTRESIGFPYVGDRSTTYTVKSVGPDVVVLTLESAFKSDTATRDRLGVEVIAEVSGTGIGIMEIDRQSGHLLTRLGKETFEGYLHSGEDKTEVNNHVIVKVQQKDVPPNTWERRAPYTTEWREVTNRLDPPPAK